MMHSYIPFLSGPRNCPLCGTSEHIRVLVNQRINPDAIDRFSFSSRKTPEFMHYQIVVCPECDLAYANTAPDSSWLRERYVEASFNAGRESEYAAMNHARLLDNILAHVPDRRAALDIGTGDGAFLSELIKRGFVDVQGIEPSLKPVSEASPHVRRFIDQGFFEKKCYRPETYSLVTCFQVLEHVENVTSLARSVFRILKPGGVFLTVGHNYRAVTARLLKSRSPIFDIEHLQLFSRQSLENMYESVGYNQIKVNPMTNVYPVSYWVKLAPIPHWLKSSIGYVGNRLGFEKANVAIRAGNIWAWGCKPI